ncbi:hypothetical protein ZWY2020_047662 [Hordeum vulgare]|nr:hypothetical protein ZWY2020_047662 [Hordeum vulgare]
MVWTTAYSRPSKLPGGGPGERRPPPPRLIRAFFGSGDKIEPRKLGAGLLAGCCLTLLTYVSLAKLYAVLLALAQLHLLRDRWIDTSLAVLSLNAMRDLWDQ